MSSYLVLGEVLQQGGLQDFLLCLGCEVEGLGVTGSTTVSVPALLLEQIDIYS